MKYDRLKVITYYAQLKKKQQIELDNLQVFYAFSCADLKKNCERFGIKDIESELTLIGGGMFVPTKNFPAYLNAVERHEKEMSVLHKKNSKQMEVYK